MNALLKQCLIVCLLANVAFVAVGQEESNTTVRAFATHYKQALALKEQSLYAEALEVLDKTQEMQIDSAGLLDRAILRAEILRITGAYQTALEVLWSVRATPRTQDTWRVRIFGRLAAVHAEYPRYNSAPDIDSVLWYLDSALALASTQPERYLFEIAGLNNELGFRLFRNGESDLARPYFRKSALAYQKLGEREHYAGAMANWLELEACTHNTAVADSISALLTETIEGNDWYATNSSVYNRLYIAAHARGDSVAMWKYKLFAAENKAQWDARINSDKMLALKELYNTEKLQRTLAAAELVEEQQKAKLQEESLLRNRIIGYGAVVSVLAAVILLLLLREKRLKRILKQSNEDLAHSNQRFQMLVTESNHRIKNNLQMVLSMVDYTQQDASPETAQTLQSIAGKIETISALHRQLNFETHNERVSVAEFFADIVEHYQQIQTTPLPVALRVDDVHIKAEDVIYLGLIVNELLANTIKHAPTNQISIVIAVQKLEKGCQFSYEDGHGFPAQVSEGTGMQLIHELVEAIQGVNFEVIHERGRFQFQFDE